MHFQPDPVELCRTQVAGNSAKCHSQCLLCCSSYDASPLVFAERHAHGMAYFDPRRLAWRVRFAGGPVGGWSGVAGGGRASLGGSG